MNRTHRQMYTNRGLTLLEMSIVLMILLALVSTGVMTFNNVHDWRLGRLASETLRTVHAAQRMYLADHPTAKVENLTPEDILPYMPGNPDSMPTVKSLDERDLEIMVDMFPPRINNGSGGIYDESDPPNDSDSLWDVGE